MAHLTGFGLENFRVFKEYTWFDFAPITILVGPNNSGKSSLIKALLLLKKNKNNLDSLSFKEGDHALISFNRVIHTSIRSEKETNNIVTFKTPLYHNSQAYILLKYQHEPKTTSAKLIDYDSFDESGASHEQRLREEHPEIFNKKSSPNTRLESMQKALGENFLPYLDRIYYLPMVKSKDHLKLADPDSIVNYIRRQRFFKDWSGKFGLIIGETPLNELTGESQVTINGRLITEVGSGIQQIIALLFFISNFVPLSHEEYDEIKQLGSYILILEEPEANLHPKFQSMLADMLVEAKKAFKIQFIVETHSEYLIRKLQYLTAKGDIKPEDVVIQYFHDPNNTNLPAGEKQVKKINILEDGRLSSPFGTGFYDESAKLMMALLTGEYLN